jgi:GT2 family glycosyltransferase
MSEPGIIAIGRNEGERLRLCLESVIGRGHTVVYVDSGSIDGSVGLARSKGVEVVELDLTRPFTAARARNAGFARLEEIKPDIQFVQFIDGDCEIAAGWLDNGCRVLEEQPQVAAVAGRRRERHPEHSIYNHIADFEWNSPAGESKYFGGDVLLRADAFRQVGGYNPTLIAGEDPDLSVRIRQHGWTLLRIDAEMTLHDIAMTRFNQWWKRNERGGFAFAQGVAMHGGPPERHWVHELRSTILWGIIVPMLILVLAWPTRGASLLAVLAYPIQAFRIARRHRELGFSARNAWLWGWNCILCRFPNALGALRYWSGRLSGHHRTLIEYKDKADPPGTSDHGAAGPKLPERPLPSSPDDPASGDDSDQLELNDPSRRRVFDPTPTRIEP